MKLTNYPTCGKRGLFQQFCLLKFCFQDRKILQNMQENHKNFGLLIQFSTKGFTFLCTHIKTHKNLLGQKPLPLARNLQLAWPPLLVSPT